MPNIVRDFDQNRTNNTEKKPIIITKWHTT